MSNFLALLRNNRAFALALGLFFAVTVACLVVERPEKAERRLAERIASGKAVPHHFYVPVYLWRGLTLNLAVTALLAGACSLAGRRLENPGSIPSAPPSSKLTTSLLFFGLIVAAANGYHRLGHSTWGDEDYTVKTYIEPQVTEKADGTLEFTRPTWYDVVWHGKRTNNHYGYTALAKLSHDLFFKPGTGPTDPFFSEALVRLPAYLSGLLSILALAWLTRLWGIRHGIWVIVLVYVLHPWLVRFGTDARGYSIVLLGLPLLFALAGRALQTGAWRWWLMLAGVQACTFWSYFAVFYVLIPLHAGLILAIWFDDSRSRTDRMTQLARWLSACLLSAVAIIQVMAPILPQLKDYIRNNAAQITGHINLAWCQDALGYLLLGTAWNEWSATNPLSISLSELSGLPLLSACIAGAGLLCAFLVGLSLLWSDKRTRWLLIPIIGGPALFLAHMTISGIKPYHWYLLLFFPGYLFAVMKGCNPVFSYLFWFFRPKQNPEGEPQRNRIAAGLGLMLIVPALILFRDSSQAQRLALVKYPIEPCRESVFLTRTITNPRHPAYGTDSITAGFTMFTEAYDPTLVRFQTVDELKGLMQKAKATRRALYINFSSRSFCEATYPDLFKLFNNPALFEHIATLNGQFDAATREVIKAR